MQCAIPVCKDSQGSCQGYCRNKHIHQKHTDVGLAKLWEEEQHDVIAWFFIQIEALQVE